MNRKSNRNFRSASAALLLAFCALTTSAPAALAPDPEMPELLTGTIYEKGPEPRRVLFKFRRTATRSNSTVRILREYHTPDGALAARERVVYENGSLLSFDVEELQSGAKGKAAVGHRELDNKTLLYFQYTPRVGARTEARNEVLRKDVLINDLIPYFIASHREELMKGSTVKCRFIVLQRTETIGFKLVKESETNWRGQPVVIVRMEPTSLVIAQLVEPVRFTIEMGGDHRILQYIGRTTPMIKRGNKWEDLDAATVFDWTPAPGK